jgi:tRNA1Val (adenine37-N6)-methyltransferase
MWVADPVSYDTPAPGLVIAQPTNGFRYGAEAFWLVGRALESAQPATALDLGTGSGVMALLLARLGVATIGYDSRPEWDACWQPTLTRSHVRAPVSLELRDLARDPPSQQVDCVVCNPPYFASHTGPTSPHPLRAAARTESTLGLAGFVALCGRVLTQDGQAHLSVPSQRVAEVMEACQRARLAPLEAVQVDRRRSVVSLARQGGGVLIRGELTRDSPRVRAWYAAATAPLASDPTRD